MADDFARKPARLESGRAAARNVDLGYGGFQSTYGKGRLGTSEIPRREAGSALLPGSVRNESRPHQQLSGNKSKSQPKSGRKDQPNFNAMAMEPLGNIAGVAASFVGAITTAGAAVFGWYIGHLYDGTVVPLLGGYVVLGGLSLVIILITERGRLFKTHHASPTH